MSLEFLEWKSEAAMEEWLEDELTYRPASLRFLPSLPDGFMWEYEEAERDGADVCMEVFRQFYIPGADVTGRRCAPCDLLVVQQVLAATSGRYVTTVAIVIELKKGSVKPRDFGQLVRYVDGIRGSEDGLIDGGAAPRHVLGAIIGDGWDRQVGQISDRISGFKVFDTTLFGSQIVLDPMGSGSWFQHGNTLNVMPQESK